MPSRDEIVSYLSQVLPPELAELYAERASNLARAQSNYAQRYTASWIGLGNCVGAAYGAQLAQSANTTRVGDPLREIESDDEIRLIHKRTGSPFLPPKELRKGLAWLTWVEQNINDNYIKELNSKFANLGDEKMKKKREPGYLFVRQKNKKSYEMREFFTRIRAMRKPVADMLREAIKIGTLQSFKSSGNIIRQWRHECRENANRVPRGYTVYRIFENRRLEAYLPSREECELNGTSRLAKWKEVTNQFRQQIAAIRRERRNSFDERYDRLRINQRPKNYMLQRGAVKQLSKSKYPVSGIKCVGIEIECLLPEKSDMTMFWPVAKFIELASDGSIRRDKAGQRATEIRVVCPVSMMREVVSKLCKVLYDMGASVNKSCGLHVHIDQRHKSVGEISLSFANLVRAQNLLMQVVPESRRHNHFCKKQRGTDFQEAVLSDRYKAVNAAAYVRHKTIEIRLMNGTIDAEKIINWAETLLAIDAGPRVLRCPKDFDVASRYWKLSEDNVRWLKFRQAKFAKIEDTKVEANGHTTSRATVDEDIDPAF